MKYEKPEMLPLVSGSASPACNDGSIASAATPGCQNGNYYEKADDCADGGDDDYCLSGTVTASQMCYTGTDASVESGSLCFSGGSVS